MSKQLKVNQKVLLICQEVIGTVVDVNNELNKVVIRAEKDGVKFDFIVTTEGFLPFSDTVMIEEIPFVEEEVVARKLMDGMYEFGKIHNIYFNSDILCLNSDTNNKTLIAEFSNMSNPEKTRTFELSNFVKIDEVMNICLASNTINENVYKKVNYLPGNNGGQTTQGEEE